MYLVLVSRNNKPGQPGYPILHGWEHPLGVASKSAIERIELLITDKYPLVQWTTYSNGMLQMIKVAYCNDELSMGFMDIQSVFPVKGIHSHYDDQMELIDELFNSVIDNETTQ